MAVRGVKKKREQASPEPWEVERLHREFPVKSQQELEDTLENCKEELDDPQNKDKQAKCVQRKLSK